MYSWLLQWTDNVVRLVLFVPKRQITIAYSEDVAIGIKKNPMAILTCQQGHILTFVSAAPFNDTARIWTRIGNDIVDLPNIVAFETNMSCPFPLLPWGRILLPPGAVVAPGRASTIFGPASSGIGVDMTLSLLRLPVKFSRIHFEVIDERLNLQIIEHAWMPFMSDIDAFQCEVILPDIEKPSVHGHVQIRIFKCSELLFQQIDCFFVVHRSPRIPYNAITGYWVSGSHSTVWSHNDLYFNAVHLTGDQQIAFTMSRPDDTSGPATFLIASKMSSSDQLSGNSVLPGIPVPNR
ncbi:hypothetical protein [Actibacterium sp. XHP0104]|uniref:hypothetical protein n=1 Tax=Actibacterium sp. XHP0104 TaxID=2984335 RepID=UPI0021E97208|nr:hypothetical protein [Actibacterium sp. XHP0104]MCV2882979.1 hypothetical protein [Actibacterium sp. XHP0104]